MKQLLKLIIFSFIISGCSVFGQNENDENCACPSGWVDASFFGLGCLFTNHTSSGTMSWQDAYIYCYNLDSRARLLEIYNEDDMIYITALLGRESQGASLYFWLGGTDIGHEGTWIWESSVEPVADFVWQDNEPGSGISYNCMGWFHYDNDGYDKAYDLPCGNSQ